MNVFQYINFSFVKKSLIPLSALYASRVIAMVSGLIFFPIYLRSLGAQQFSIVAIIVSLSLLAVAMDFGLATVVSRSIARAGVDQISCRRVLMTAEFNLFALYLFVSVAVLIACLMRTPSLAFIWSLIPPIVWIAVSQNLHQSSLVACGKTTAGGISGGAAALARGGAGAAAVIWVAPTIESYVYSQLVSSGVMLAITRYLAYRAVDEIDKFSGSLVEANRGLFYSGLQMLASAGPIMFASVANAAASQADKAILAVNIPPNILSSYFLAHTMASVPLLAVAGPLFQFYQPALMRDADNPMAQFRVYARAQMAVAALTLPISILLFVFANQLTMFWLHQRTVAVSVAHYARILLVAYTIAALGFAPFGIIIGRRLFKYHLAVSAVSAFLILSLVSLASIAKSAEMACMAYIVYQTLVALAFRLRAFRGYAVVHANSTF